MGVREIIEQLRSLHPDERRQVQTALENLAGQPAAAADQPAAADPGEAAWDRLLQGLGSAGGKHLSAGIDDALYGGER